MCLWTGCAYRVALESDPPGATVTLPSGERVVTPDTVKLRYRTISGPQTVLVTYPGMRTMEVNVRKTAMPPFGFQYITDPVFRPGVAFGKKPRSEIRFMMVREHGAAGSWNVDEQIE